MRILTISALVLFSWLAPASAETIYGNAAGGPNGVCVPSGRDWMPCYGGWTNPAASMLQDNHHGQHNSTGRHHNDAKATGFGATRGDRRAGPGGSEGSRGAHESGHGGGHGGGKQR
jgi:hypothetical protein